MCIVCKLEQMGANADVLNEVNNLVEVATSLLETVSKIDAKDQTQIGFTGRCNLIRMTRLVFAADPYRPEDINEIVEQFLKIAPNERPFGTENMSNDEIRERIEYAYGPVRRTVFEAAQIDSSSSEVH